jgi:hypothetical protein
MNEPSQSDPGPELRAGERVCLDGRAGVLRYLYGNGAAVVRFDQATDTKVVPVRRLVACADEHPPPDR